MSCSAQFPSDISLSCVFGLVAEVRNGITPATAKKALWIGGCLLEKVAPANLPPLADTQTLSVYPDLNSVVDDLEAQCNTLASVEAGEVATLDAPVAGTQGWEVLIPIIFELIKFIIEQRQKKKQEPAPTPAPAPAVAAKKK